MPAGRPPRFAAPEDMEKLFYEWKDYLKETGEIADVEGFCDFAGIWRDKFSDYGNKEEFHDTVKKIKNWIYYRKKQLAMANKMNAAIFIFDAKNNFGYVDKTEVTNEHTGEVAFTNDLPRPKKDD